MPVTAETTSVVPDWIAEAVAGVPEASRFAGPDELEAGLLAIAQAHPRTVTRTRVGTSRLGDPIHALQIGDSPRHALVFALPHPNEPVGGLTALHLAARLAADDRLRDRLGLTFTIVGCIDPDGLRLNDAWLVARSPAPTTPATSTGRPVTSRSNGRSRSTTGPTTSTRCCPRRPRWPG